MSGLLTHATTAFLLFGSPWLYAAGLRWDALQKEARLDRGVTNAHAVFSATNATTESITVLTVSPSCHCTVAKLDLPYAVAPGKSFSMPVDVDVAVKFGILDKTVTVITTADTNVLSLRIFLPEPTARERNQMVSFASRQAVFVAECAQCHLQPAVGKKGAQLFKAICAICHEAEHRAEMVPDLAKLKHPNDAAYWEQTLRIGKPGTLMPAFSKPFGGPLDQAQLDSLVPYLMERFPSAEKPSPASK